MFGLIHLFRSSSPPPLVSLIDSETTILGDTIAGTGDLRVEGTVRADIERDGRVVVANGGTVHGSIRAQSIRVAGTVRGKLHADEGLELMDSADVRARLQAASLTIAAGADVRGDICDPDASTPSLSPLLSVPSGERSQERPSLPTSQQSHIENSDRAKDSPPVIPIRNTN